MPGHAHACAGPACRTTGSTAQPCHRPLRRLHFPCGERRWRAPSACMYGMPRVYVHHSFWTSPITLSRIQLSTPLATPGPQPGLMVSSVLVSFFLPPPIRASLCRCPAPQLRPSVLKITESKTIPSPRRFRVQDASESKTLPSPSASEFSPPFRILRMLMPGISCRPGVRRASIAPPRCSSLHHRQHHHHHHHHHHHQASPATTPHIPPPPLLPLVLSPPPRDTLAPPLPPPYPYIALVPRRTIHRLLRSPTRPSPPPLPLGPGPRPA
jgi:hypothetical protein